MRQAKPPPEAVSHLPVEGPEFPQGGPRKDKDMIISGDEEAAQDLKALLRFQWSSRQPVQFDGQHTTGTLRSYRPEVDSKLSPLYCGRHLPKL